MKTRGGGGAIAEDLAQVSAPQPKRTKKVKKTAVSPAENVEQYNSQWLPEDDRPRSDPNHLHGEDTRIYEKALFVKLQSIAPKLATLVAFCRYRETWTPFHTNSELLASRLEETPKNRYEVRTGPQNIRALIDSNAYATDQDSPENLQRAKTFLLAMEVAERIKTIETIKRRDFDFRFNAELIGVPAGFSSVKVSVDRRTDPPSYQTTSNSAAPATGYEAQLIDAVQSLKSLSADIGRSANAGIIDLGELLLDVVEVSGRFENKRRGGTKRIFKSEHETGVIDCATRLAAQFKIRQRGKFPLAPKVYCELIREYLEDTDAKPKKITTAEEGILDDFFEHYCPGIPLPTKKITIKQRSNATERHNDALDLFAKSVLFTMIRSAD